MSGRLAANVRAVRERRNLGLADLSRRLAAVGRPTSAGTIYKIEQGERRVDADDLVALALALGVNPSTLLLPATAGDEDVPLTEAVSAPGWAAWQWADGSDPLPTRGEDEGFNTGGEHEEWALHARPAELRRRTTHPAGRALARVAGYVQRSITSPPEGERARQTRREGYERARAALDAEMDELLSGRRGD